MNKELSTVHSRDAVNLSSIKQSKSPLTKLSSSIKLNRSTRFPASNSHLTSPPSNSVSRKLNQSNKNDKSQQHKSISSSVRGVIGGSHSRKPSQSTLDSSSSDDNGSDGSDSTSDLDKITISSRKPASVSTIHSSTQPGLVTSPFSLTASLSQELSQKQLRKRNNKTNGVPGRNKGTYVNHSQHSQDNNNNTLRPSDRTEKNDRFLRDRDREYLSDKTNPSSREIQQGQSSSRPSQYRGRDREKVRRYSRSRERTTDDYRHRERCADYVDRHRTHSKSRERGGGHDDTHRGENANAYRHKDRDHMERGRQMTYDHDGRERAKSKTRERGREREFDNDNKMYRNNNEPHHDMDSNNKPSYQKSLRKTNDKSNDISKARAKSLTRDPSGSSNDSDLQHRQSRRTREKNVPMGRNRSKSLTRDLEGKSGDVNKESLRNREFEKLMERDRTNGRFIRNGGEKDQKNSDNEDVRSKQRGEHDEKVHAKSRAKDDDKGTHEKEFELEKDPKLLINRIGLKQQKNEEPLNMEKDEPRSSSGKITVRIFIEESQQYKSITLTSDMTALDVMTIFRSDNTISDAGAWTIFELVPEFDLGINHHLKQRPLRDWESLAWIIGRWELDRGNSLVLKKYAYRNALTLAGFNEHVPSIYGVLYIEVKKSKWQKRYFYIKDGSMYHSKDTKGTNETFLCSMVSFDVFICTKLFKTFPTNFVFAVKSLDKITMFENPENDYMHYLCAENLNKMNEWLLAIRTVRNKIMREESPELFVDIPIKNEKPSAPINLTMPLTNALPAAVSKTTSLMSEISFELASISTTPLSKTVGNDATNQDTTTALLSTSKWDSLRQHVRSASGGSLLDFFDNPPGTISPSFVELSKKAPFSKSPSFERKDIKKVDTINSPKTTHPNDDSNKKKEQTSVFKGGSLLDYDDKLPPIKPIEPEQVTFAKGSLLSNGTMYEQAKEREKIRRAMGGVGIIRDPNSGTLLNLDNNVKFNKGSLLDRNIEGSGNGINKTIQRKKSMGNTLIHNQQSRQNNFQPLLNFGNDQRVFEFDGIKSSLIKSPPIKSPPIKSPPIKSPLGDGERDSYF
ncbi:12957_t:CDS:10 [Funneliformis geosporum]|uniref:14655_t:CDS:1 n=1 Tax=Funneliformis geosporum TaxID=1117311 RepID=A0A9W4SSC7_9GLOM|nr:12957_t:CDS:10 [Funneliformis geosporum]CAI2178787.1 14655_t:CDS:10 [Funneliformis geosporum]